MINDNNKEDLLTTKNFYPYQFLNWEDDIIYDPQLSSNKINANSKLNAAYAGWIPSQHCRTMAAFQVNHLISLLILF